MESGFQFQDVTYYGHGQMVVDRFEDLLGDFKLEWRLPDNFDNFKQLYLSAIKEQQDIIKTYQLWHDCSKPFCLEIDTEGKKHYPNHAKMSKEIWLQIGGNELEAELIGRDMDCHLMKSGELGDYDRQDLLPILLITALCETHANAGMFGGIESTSFKIKWKNLNKLFKKFLETK